MMFKRRDNYGSWLCGEFGAIIDALDLDAQRKRFLRSRWLDQVVWLEKKAGEAQRRYYRLRTTTVVGPFSSRLLSQSPHEPTHWNGPCGSPRGSSV
jgi:hypothetical protein